jgi:hypothetical protein
LFVNPREAVEMMDVGLHDLMAFLTSSTFVKFPWNGKQIHFKCTD